MLWASVRCLMGAHELHVPTCYDTSLAQPSEPTFRNTWSGLRGRGLTLYGAVHAAQASRAQSHVVTSPSTPPGPKMPSSQTLSRSNFTSDEGGEGVPRGGSSSHGRLRTEEPFTNAPREAHRAEGDECAGKATPTRSRQGRSRCQRGGSRSAERSDDAPCPCGTRDHHHPQNRHRHRHRHRQQSTPGTDTNANARNPVAKKPRIPP